MDVGSGRQTGGADESDELARRHLLPRADAELGQMAVHDPDMRVDDHRDEITGAHRVVSGVRGAGGGGVDGGSFRRGQVDARVEMPRGTGRVVRFEVHVGAPKPLGHDGTHHDSVHREPHVARNLRGRGEPRRHAQTADGEDANHAFASACPRCFTASCSVDWTLCAAFSLPPMAPGTLKTIRRDASANRWWIGLTPVRSSANPIESTNSCAGCMKRLVVKWLIHIFDRWLLSGSMNSSAARGAVMASTTRIA